MRGVGQGAVFSDPRIKAEMLSLRRKGSTYKELAEKYKVDPSSVVYHCVEAGLTLKNETRYLLYNLAKQGVSTEEIAAKLEIPGTVVDFYCAQRGMKRQPVKTRSPLRTAVIKKDERGVKWSSDFNGDWICMGKSREQRLIDKANKKKRELELKRLQMLTY